MPDLPTKFIPRLKGLVEPRVEQEIVLAFERVYSYYESKITNLESKLQSQGSQVNAIAQSPLFAGALAIPLIENTPDVAEAAQGGATISVSQVPNLPASKITSGNLAIARHAANVLKTDDALNQDVTGAPNVNTGKIIIKDNAGNSIKVMTCA